VSEEKKRAKEYGRKENLLNAIDLTTQSGKSKASMILHKLQNFYSLKLGDVIVIPNYGSSKFSFGFIDDYGIYVDNEQGNECEYRKRRKVKWVVHRHFDELDTIFYNLKKSMHAISSVKSTLAEHIDRVMNDVYFKDGFGHYVIRVKKKEDIKAEDLFKLGEDIMKLLKIINEHNKYNENVSETIVKLNVQSDGDILLKGPIGNSIVSLALVFSLVACNENHNQVIPDDHHTRRAVASLKDTLTSLEVQVYTRK
jgi:restriction system protein